LILLVAICRDMASRILIADDHEMVRRGIRSLLESCRDVEVLEASDGREAVEKAKESNPDLIILDISMPRLDGFSAAREIRVAAVDTPILILTFEKTEMLAEMAQSIGVSGYITKGEGGDVLLKAIDAAIGNRGPAPCPRKPDRSPKLTSVLRVLILHRDEACIRRCLQELEDLQLEIEADVASAIQECAKRLNSNEYDLILAEYPIPRSAVIPTGDLLRRTDRHVPLILLTHNMDRKAAVDLITEGAADCVETDNLGQLPLAIRRTLKENVLRGERNRVERKLQQSEAHYRALTGNLSFGICRCGMEGQFLDVNQALLTMLGYESKDELLSLNLAKDVLSDDSKRAHLLGESCGDSRVDPLETVWTCRNGAPVKVRLSGREVNTDRGKRSGYEIIVQDVTKQRELEDDLRQQASRDPLTGLANYRCFLAMVDSEINRFKRTGREFAVLLFDLDGLKQLNDRYGHLTGSAALCRLADVLAAGSRNIDVAARFGGDEFGVILAETRFEAATSVAKRLCDNLANDGKSPQLSVSVGVAMCPTDGESIETLLLAADKALYRDKSDAQRRSRIIY
jgi:diguanylate cyclase (GGDEF)-like protein/PAS domain S-box-containing protein